jgi:putative hydrolase of the HAD superfamily
MEAFAGDVPPLSHQPRDGYPMARVFFDFDGVVVRSRSRDKTFLWQADLEVELGIGPSVKAALFQQPMWNEIICGRQHFRDHLRMVFQAARLTCSPDEFIEFWLANDLNWYTRVLELADHLKASGHELFIATNQDAIRSAHIRKQRAVTQLFDDVFTSADLGVCKPTVEFYTAVRRRLPVTSDVDCIVIDDAQRNIEAAASVGWRGVLFDPDLLPSHTPEYLASELRNLL